ncbi:hypothetical protein IC582_008860 [Cucumis melo]
MMKEFCRFISFQNLYVHFVLSLFVSTFFLSRNGIRGCLGLRGLEVGLSSRSNFGIVK